MNTNSGTGPVPLIGPLDISNFADRTGFIDFGRILIPNNIPDLIIKGEIESDTQRFVAVTLEIADSVLQVSVFSTPKSEEIWPEVGDQLARTLAAEGAQVVEESTSLGFGLLVTPAAPSKKYRSLQEVTRFVGLDGSRWFLRGSISGAALENSASRDAIEAVYRSIVVDRGDDPMPPRELLGLTLPAGNVAPPRQI
jgi:hypothetical protein